MNQLDYDFLSHFLQRESGLSLGPGKEYLLEARLVPLAQSLGLANFEELVLALRRGKDTRLSSAVTEAMTTNETSFFRDKSPFEDLRLRVLPALIAARSTSRVLRFWCAAASSGQEAYSVLMTMDEYFPELRNWRIEFIATDISPNILARAEAGVYSQFEVQRGLPIQMLMKYFDQCSAGWQVKPALRNRVKFRQINLLDDFRGIGTCDIVFCRNVLIYFDVDTKRKIFEGMARLVSRDGYLFLGAAETVLGICEQFKRYRECTAAVYVPAVPVTA